MCEINGLPSTGCELAWNHVFTTECEIPQCKILSEDFVSGGLIGIRGVTFETEVCRLPELNSES
jgi:hypothetical protein